MAMTIDVFLMETAWRLRAYLGRAADRAHTDAEALAALQEAEHQAARYQLPQFAASRYRRCAHTDPAGCQCQALAITPVLYGFLCRNPAAPIYQDACWPFIGGLCARHTAHLIVPPTSWWPQEMGALCAERQEAIAL